MNKSTSENDQELPCPFDPKHTYRLSRKFHHLKRCTKIRDWAYSAGLPFAKPSLRSDLESYESLTNSEAIYPELDKDGNVLAKGLCIPAKKLHRAFQKVCSYLKLSEQFVLDSPATEQHLGSDFGFKPQNSCNFDNSRTDYLVESTNKSCEQILYLTLVASTKNAIEKRHNAKYIVSSDSKLNETLKLLKFFKDEYPKYNLRNECIMSPEIISNTLSYDVIEKLSLLNRDEIQNACILASCLTFKLLKTSSKIPEQLIIDFGGELQPHIISKIIYKNQTPIQCYENSGKGSLTRWLSFATQFIIYNQNNEPTSSISPNESNSIETEAITQADTESRIIIIERESRRNKKENKDENMKELKADQASKVIRFRQDIQFFDLNALLCYCNYSDQSMKNKPYIPNFIDYLIKQDVRLKYQLDDLNSIYKLVREMGQGGGPSLKRIDNSLSKYYCGHNIENILIIAKHLCGNATDFALRNIVEDLSDYTSKNNIKNSEHNMAHTNVVGSIAIVTCCHHRCELSDLVGREYIKDELGFTDPEISALMSITGWATGTFGAKCLLGKKVKRIIDASRIWWLHKSGFNNAKLIKYTPNSISPENFMICASK